MGKTGTGVKFSSKARKAPGNIPITDELQRESNSKRTSNSEVRS